MWFAGGLEALYMDVSRRNGKMFLPNVGEVESPRIDKLLSATDGTPKTMGVTAFSDRRKRYRAKAESLASMLHTHPDYRDGYREFFSTLAGGASSEEAFQRVYGKSPERVDQDLREYRAARRSGEFWTPAQPAGPDESVRPASAPEDTAMLEDLRTALATGQVERFE
jgi:hypothetical protein